jgi:hypothetical protein
MKKKLLFVGGALVVAGGIFAAGTFTGASTDWQTNAVNGAYSELLGTASTTTNQITSNADTEINNTINTAIQSTVDQQQTELQRLLDQYYQMKLDGLTGTPEFKSLEQQISQIRQSVFDAYKKQIDEAFAKQQSQQ